MSGLFKLGSSQPADTSDPIAFLGACHRRIEDKLAMLARVIETLRAGDKSKLGECQDALRAFVKHFDEAGHKHTLDEEASVFPRLRHDVVAKLTGEHREHEAIYLAVRAVAQRIIDGHDCSGRVDDLEVHGRAMMAIYKDHIATEETVLFPAMREQLDDKELRAIGIEMRLRRG